MDVVEYRKEFVEQVKTLATALSDFEGQVFTDEACELLAEAGEMSDYFRCHYRGVGSRNRRLAVDGCAFDDADDSTRIVVSEWGGLDVAATLTQTEAKAALGRARAFIEESTATKFYESLENSTEACGVSRDLFDRQTGTSRYRIYLVTDKLLSERARDFPEGLISGVAVEYHIWDIARLHRVVESRSGQDETDIDLTVRANGGLPCIDASVESDDYKAYLCVIRGDVLAKIFDDFGSRLLEGNVRSFLSSKGKVNKGIRATIRGEPRMFFAYNNGIAATASDITLQGSSGGKRLISVKNLQIVNGGQTTASLTAAMRDGGCSLELVFVQMKLSVVPPDRAGEVIPLIARYANSQNKVSEADFFSNHDFHRRIEGLSRRLWAPAIGGAQHESHWFYERARGQYVNEQNNLTKAQRARFLLQNPKKHMVSKTDLAKVENAWAGKPHIVSLGAQKNFLNFAGSIAPLWETKDAEFNEEYFRRVIAKVIIWSELERTVSAASWYQGGYRANVVAYSMAKLASLVASSAVAKEVDLASIWAAQRIGPEMQEQLGLVAEKMFQVLVNPAAGYQNVTEWSKREQCWKRAEEVSIRLLGSSNSWLVTSKRVGEERKEAKKRQADDNKISKVLRVVELGPVFWAAVRIWGRDKSLFRGHENELVSRACRANFVPNDRQAAELLDMLQKARDDGFSTLLGERE